jgi:putative inorganic carbon (hco3(-)) transporter
VRDILLTSVIAVLLVFTLRNPFYGLLTWVWLGIMNPHRLTYGFAYSLPFAQIVAILTLLSALLNRDKLCRFPVNGVTVTLIIFILWLGVSPLFGVNADYELDRWSRAMKIQVMVLFSLIVMAKREDIEKMVWVLALSVGFYGIKGGVFTIASAGSSRVWGPEGSFIADNNTLALTIIMIVPLFRYLQLQSKNLWLRRGCMLAMLLCTVSAVGSQSRGAFLALLAMATFLWLKSRNKAMLGVLVVAVLPLVFIFMPDSWTQRMETIQTYDADASAMGRINAWWMAWNLAVDRFPIGGGFSVANAITFQLYAPDPTSVLTAHSIYFQILGEHGFLGLALFLAIFWMAWRNAGWVVRRAAKDPSLTWAGDLGAMCQVSLIGYGVGGAFLSLSYFDLPYYIVAIVVVLKQYVIRDMEERRQSSPAELRSALLKPGDNRR